MYLSSVNLEVAHKISNFFSFHSVVTRLCRVSLLYQIVFLNSICKIKFCGEFSAGPNNTQKFQFNCSGVVPGHVIFKALQMILMINQESYYIPIIVFPHLSPVWSLRCSHRISFLIFDFQMSCFLHSFAPLRVSSQQQWGRVNMSKSVDNEKGF